MTAFIWAFLLSELRGEQKTWNWCKVAQWPQEQVSSFHHCRKSERILKWRILIPLPSSTWPSMSQFTNKGGTGRQAPQKLPAVARAVSPWGADQHHLKARASSPFLPSTNLLPNQPQVPWGHPNNTHQAYRSRDSGGCCSLPESLRSPQAPWAAHEANE